LLTLFRVDYAVVGPAAKTARSLVISPNTTQVKAIGSKMIFTCGISVLDNLLPRRMPEFRWIDPRRRVVAESKGRYEFSQPVYVDTS